MHEGTNVEWREWGPAAFEAADSRGQPVLLALVTSWAAECHEMDATTYTDPRIAANINDSFVPVRADADRRPGVRERYNMGGFPSTVFLTPEGTVLTGATFLGVEGFRGILDSVRRTWDARGEAAGSVPRALRDAEPPGGTVGARVEEHMIEQLLAAFDDEFGGWGGDVKFPMPEAVEFALVRARDRATRTLEAVQTHLLDTYDGGFYRFAGARNWSQVRREKLADQNGALCRAFARGYRYTGEKSYRDAAARAAEYLTTTLWTGDAVAAGQGGDPEYFTLGPTERENADPPPVDDTVLADRNGLAVEGLLTFVGYTDDDRTRRYARRARDYVCDELVDDGRVTHHDGSGSRSGLLLDQARVLAGLTTSWQVLGEPGPARAVADWTLDHLEGDHGAFLDGPRGDAGLLNRPLVPLDTNAECADALLDLAALTGEPRYRRAARRALDAFADATDRMGVEVAGYAAAVTRARNPRRVEVGTPAGDDLHRAALRLTDHETVVVPDADCAGARLLVDGTVAGEAASPAALEALLTGPADDAPA
jgi:uncharacterized protein YyaL (SSP411 family)